MNLRRSFVFSLLSISLFCTAEKSEQVKQEPLSIKDVHANLIQALAYWKLTVRSYSELVALLEQLETKLLLPAISDVEVMLYGILVSHIHKCSIDNQ